MFCLAHYLKIYNLIVSYLARDSDIILICSTCAKCKTDILTLDCIICNLKALCVKNQIHLTKETILQRQQTSICTGEHHMCILSANIKERDTATSSKTAVL